MITSKPGQPLVWSNRVAPPHVWQGILFCLSAMALSQPDLFDTDQHTWPLGGHGGPAGGMALLLLGSVALWRRRAR